MAGEDVVAGEGVPPGPSNTIGSYRSKVTLPSLMYSGSKTTALPAVNASSAALSRTPARLRSTLTSPAATVPNAAETEGVDRRQRASSR